MTSKAPGNLLAGGVCETFKESLRNLQGILNEIGIDSPQLYILLQFVFRNVLIRRFLLSLGSQQRAKEFEWENCWGTIAVGLGQTGSEAADGLRALIEFIIPANPDLEFEKPHTASLDVLFVEFMNSFRRYAIIREPNSTLNAFAFKNILPTVLTETFPCSKCGQKNKTSVTIAEFHTFQFNLFVNLMITDHVLAIQEFFKRRRWSPLPCEKCKGGHCWQRVSIVNNPINIALEMSSRSIRKGTVRIQGRKYEMYGEHGKNKFESELILLCDDSKLVDLN